jgi:hypothetical protein
MPSIKLDELENAAILVDDGEGSAHALVARDTGLIHLLNDEYMDEEAPLPGDIEAEGLYVSVPAASTLGLGRELMLRFGAAQLPGDQERLRELFASRDPYDGFSRLVEEHGLRDAWSRFREEETRTVLQRWCGQHSLQLEG